jgi:hypothetical protein
MVEINTLGRNLELGIRNYELRIKNSQGWSFVIVFDLDIPKKKGGQPSVMSTALLILNS